MGKNRNVLADTKTPGEAARASPGPWQHGEPVATAVRRGVVAVRRRACPSRGRLCPRAGASSAAPGHVSVAAGRGSRGRLDPQRTTPLWRPVLSGCMRCGLARAPRPHLARAPRPPPRPRRRGRGLDRGRGRVAGCPTGGLGRPPRPGRVLSCSVEVGCGGSLFVSMVLGFSYGRSMGTRISTMDVITSHQLRHAAPGARVGPSAASRELPLRLPTAASGSGRRLVPPRPPGRGASRGRLPPGPRAGASVASQRGGAL